MNNLGTKILAVMAEVESVDKDGYNAFHKYKYTSDVAIVTAIRKSLIKNKLVVLPNQKLCTQSGDMTILTIDYTIMDVDSGENMVLTVVGYGKDSGDKGVYKAATGAEKYFLLKTFLIPTDDDPEKEGTGKKKTDSAPIAKPIPPSVTAKPTSPPVVEQKPKSALIQNGKPARINIQNAFDVPKEFESKTNGKKYWKTMDGDGKPYIIFDAIVAAYVGKRAGELMLAEIEFTDKGSSLIVGFRDVKAAA